MAPARDRSVASCSTTSDNVTAMSPLPVPSTPIVFVLFGAAGDLAKRMVIPAFYSLAQEKLLPEDYLLIGNGRGDLSHEDFRTHVHKSLTDFGTRPDAG